MPRSHCGDLRVRSAVMEEAGASVFRIEIFTPKKVTPFSSETLVVFHEDAEYHITEDRNVNKPGNSYSLPY